jgi:hypothetical protein
VAAARAAAKAKTAGRPPLHHSQKLLLGAAHLHKLVDTFDDTVELQIELALTFELLQFALFARWDDLSQVRMRDVVFFTQPELGVDRCIMVFMPRRKNDQQHKGGWLPVALLDGSPYCPVARLQRFIRRHRGGAGTNDFLFGLRRKSAAGAEFAYYVDGSSQRVPYDTIRRSLHTMLVTIGVDPKEYGTQSWRSGGCSAVADSDVSERVLKKHGAWTCDKSKDGYVREKMGTRLAVTQTLGLGDLDEVPFSFSFPHSLTLVCLPTSLQLLLSYFHFSTL